MRVELNEDEREVARALNEQARVANEKSGAAIRELAVRIETLQREATARSQRINDRAARVLAALLRSRGAAQVGDSLAPEVDAAGNPVAVEVTPAPLSIAGEAFDLGGLDV